MYMKNFVITVVAICVIIILRIFYLIFMKCSKREKNRENPAKTMIILGSGGHTAEMLRIIRYLDFANYSPRVYIHAQTDELSVAKVKDLENDNSDYKIIKICRSREVRQSYITSIWTTILATLNCLPILWKENPELILCNGPGTCIPLCVLSFLFKVFFISQTVIIFVESFCRVKTFSLTGKILYYLADDVIVQWPYLTPDNFQRMARDPTITVPWELLSEELKNIPVEIKVYLMSIINELHTSDKKLTSEKWMNTLITRVAACLDRTWEALNSGYWKDVPIEYRYCYSICIVVKTILLKLQYEINIEKLTNKEKKDALKNIINQIDKGILLGAPLPGAPNLLTTIAAELNSYCADESNNTNLRQIPIDDDKIDNVILSGFSEVVHYEMPSMESFYRDVFMPKCPAVLTGCMKHWKALTLWKNPNYLCKIAGSRTVPIEIGSRYTEEDWSQHLVNFSEFLQKHVITSGNQIAYLAQHQLFEQIPALKKDFVIPEYCSFSDSQENYAESPDINAWFGPGDTVSPLHFDPKNNLLSQVFGYKKIILYHPDETDKLYPYNTRLLNNTAQVDPINPDYSKWPNFRNAQGTMCYLKPGEMLYIPPKWWHHVTALTPSFSISFWWN